MQLKLTTDTFKNIYVFPSRKKSIFANDREKETSLEDNSPVLASCYPANLISELVLLAVY